MLPAPKNRQTIVSPDLDIAYHDRIVRVEAAYYAASNNISEYWWALFEIYRDNLWRAKADAGRFVDWLGDLSKEAWGPSRQDFYDTMGAVERLMKMGLTESEIKERIGRFSTAHKTDLKLLFTKNGKGELLPDVKAQLAEGGETPAEFALRLDTLGPGERRAAVRGLVEKDHIFFTDGVYDERLGRAMANVLWENDNGIVIKGTCLITFTETTEPKQSKTGTYLPEMIGRLILKWLRADSD